MDKTVVLKKICVVAAVLCLPLWYLAYAMVWSEWPEIAGGTAWPGIGGAPLALLLLILGYVLKKRRAAVVLCAAGLVVFAAVAAWALGGAAMLGSYCWQPFGDKITVGSDWTEVEAAEADEVQLWLGRDDAGEDIWLTVDDEADRDYILWTLAKLECYKKPLAEDFGVYSPGAEDEANWRYYPDYADVAANEPVWHFRVVWSDGSDCRVALGNLHYFWQPQHSDDSDLNLPMLYPNYLAGRLAVGEFFYYPDDDKTQEPQIMDKSRLVLQADSSEIKDYTLAYSYEGYYLLSENGGEVKMYQARPYVADDGRTWNTAAFSVYQMLLQKYLA